MDVLQEDYRDTDGKPKEACGVFGVTGRNWWRVYVGALATLAALAALAWAYVWVGIL